ncbi:MAG: EAL domain-containing protein (putative c-di-GMP-specific phosphodiesterase class I) [Paraglaciecola sp.]|jgi:EAL domain-containing protein (putative c-di-GMP-specific phosphodiesterase class I)
MQAKQVPDNFNVDNIVPYFQPIMDLANGAVWRYECLARLVTLDENTYLPSEFLFLVERQQAVALLTETIFNRSARYFKDINMAWNINISLADMKDLSIHRFLASQLRDYPNPERIALEITAHNALSDKQSFETFSKVCGDLGIGIFIDHFGKQTKRMDEILDLGISAIKVSGALIDHISKNQQSLDIVTDLYERAKDKKVALIAEHIEDVATLEVVKKIGIKYAQGFYFSRPKAKAE